MHGDIVIQRRLKDKQASQLEMKCRPSQRSLRQEWHNRSCAGEKKRVWYVQYLCCSVTLLKACWPSLHRGAVLLNHSETWRPDLDFPVLGATIDTSRSSRMTGNLARPPSS